MVGVGGTKLTTNGAGGPWQSETTWHRCIVWGKLGEFDGRRCRTLMGERQRFHGGGCLGAHLRWGTLSQFDRGWHRDGKEDRRARRPEAAQSDALTATGSSTVSRE
jgi:hypothetical protein